MEREKSSFYTVSTDDEQMKPCTLVQLGPRTSFLPQIFFILTHGLQLSQALSLVNIAFAKYDVRL